MHLAIEAAGTEDRGGAVVLREFLEECRVHPRISRVTLFAPKAFVAPDWDQITHVVVELPAATTKVCWALRGWRAARKQSKADVALSFNGFSLADNQSVFVHNALCFDPAISTMPPSQRGRLGILRELTLQACHEANQVIVQTEHMASYFAEFPRIRKKLKQVLHGRTMGPAKGESSFSTSNSRILYVGSELPFKDTKTLYEALETLPKMECVLIGNWGESSAPPNAKWIGHVAEATTLWAHYRDADVVVMTSLCESLGLPLLEAMAAGVPLVVPDLPYAREICGDAAIYFQPSNASMCASAIETALQPAVHSRLVVAGTKRYQTILNADNMRRFVDLVVG